jgi:Xaa-Pro aminopeptidase
MSARLDALRDRLSASEVDALLSLDAVTNDYLSNFSGSTSAVIVTAGRAVLVTDFRYREQARAEVSGFELREASDSYMREVCKALSDTGARKVGFEPDRMTVKLYREVGEWLSTVELVAVDGLVSKLRACKDRVELEKIRRAAEIASAVVSEVPSIVKEGVSERELASEIEYLIRNKGADGSSFDPIALFGERSSLPHGKPSDRRLASGDIVLVDLGARCNGYNSDLTRTWVYHRILTARTKEIYEIVKSAQEASLAAVKAGISCADFDAVGRAVIQESGYGDSFGHGLGHGVGLEVHEFPRISAQSADQLEEGMVITVEPGIYIPGEGGVRIEDLVVVTATGCEVLTDAERRFAVI